MKPLRSIFSMATNSMLAGVGTPNERAKLAIINKSQASANHLPKVMKTGGMPLEDYLVFDK